jgi:hypothetical protein
MAQVTTWTWNVYGMDTIPDVPNQPNYVVNIFWTLVGTDGVQTASAFGQSQLAIEQSQPDFIPYANITEAIAIGWVQEALGATGIASYEANVQNQINNLENPLVVPTPQPLPWATPSQPTN